MSAQIVPFPLARRHDMIARQSRYAAALKPDSSERFIQRQLEVQRDNMRRRGIAEDLVARELWCMETAIRRELHASISTRGA